ncbi:hypothetical protein ACU19_08515 [Actinobaculum suis]|nr:hypothetical protein ACU19_08515 [Actinobaculum suis]
MGGKLIGKPEVKINTAVKATQTRSATKSASNVTRIGIDSLTCGVSDERGSDGRDSGKGGSDERGSGKRESAGRNSDRYDRSSDQIDRPSARYGRVAGRSCSCGSAWWLCGVSARRPDARRPEARLPAARLPAALLPEALLPEAWLPLAPVGWFSCSCLSIPPFCQISLSPSGTFK